MCVLLLKQRNQRRVLHRGVHPVDPARFAVHGARHLGGRRRDCGVPRLHAHQQDSVQPRPTHRQGGEYAPVRLSFTKCYLFRFRPEKYQILILTPQALGFQQSSLPLILSFENHCSVAGQDKVGSFKSVCTLSLSLSSRQSLFATALLPLKTR